MDHYKSQSTKSKIFLRLIPTLMFIVAITTIVLTVFFMLVLQSRNAYQLDGDDDAFSIDNDDFQMEIDGATSDQIANLDIDGIRFEDNTNSFTTTPQPQYETFLLKKTINPTTNNHIQTNNDLQSMKAYKIVSKKPIIENSLVKIVMAPHNILEKLSRQDQRNGKYAIDTIDKSGNAPIKGHSCDDIYSRESIQNGNDNGNVNVDVFSLENEENIDFMETVQPIQPERNVLHHHFNNIQVITKMHKQPLKMILNEQKIPLDLITEIKIGNNPNQNESVRNSEFKSIELETNSMEVIPEIESSSYKTLPVTTEAIAINAAFTDAEELISNPTTSQNLIPTLVPEPEDVKFKSIDDTIITEINASDHRTGEEYLENLPMKSIEISTENSAPVVVLKVLRNRTVLLEETRPHATPDQLAVEAVPALKTVTPVVRPKKITRPSTTTTKAPKIIEVKKQQFPKKASVVNSFNKYKKVGPKIDDVSFEDTTKTGLLDVETTEVLSLSETIAKSKNTKRAVGDEGSFASNIVRPSPIRPKKIGDLFPHETDAERAERLSKSMQRLMHFVTIVGHVDSYLTKRVRNGLKNVARIFDSVEDTRRRRRHNL